MVTRVWLPLTIFLLVASTRLATGAPANKEAAQLVDQGFKEFHLGNWEAAIKAFEEAYRLDPDPNYLFDLAQAYRNKPNYDKSIFYFRSYLASKSSVSPKERKEIEGVVQQLEQQRAAQQESARIPPQGVRLPESQPSAGADPTKPTMTGPPPVPAESEPAPWYSRGWGWGLSGAGIVAAGVGIGFLVWASQTDADVANAPEADQQGLRDAANSRRIVGGITLATGALAVAAGITIFAWPMRHGATKRARATTAFAVGPGWLIVQGEF